MNHATYLTLCPVYTTERDGTKPFPDNMTATEAEIAFWSLTAHPSSPASHYLSLGRTHYTYNGLFTFSHRGVKRQEKAQ